MIFFKWFRAEGVRGGENYVMLYIDLYNVANKDLDSLRVKC